MSSADHSFFLHMVTFTSSTQSGLGGVRGAGIWSYLDLFDAVVAQMCLLAAFVLSYRARHNEQELSSSDLGYE